MSNFPSGVFRRQAFSTEIVPFGLRPSISTTEKYVAIANVDTLVELAMYKDNKFHIMDFTLHTTDLFTMQTCMIYK